jgi:sugar phosphate isomerase/epimerase
MPGSGRHAAGVHDRLGLNVHRDAWPTAATLAAQRTAGFAWVQVHTPPRAMLAERRHALRHARALRRELEGSGLRLLLHAPDDLSAGTLDHDRALDGLLDYAAAAGAELIAYHGLNFAEADGPAAARLRERAQLEERSLTPRLQRAHSLGITVAIENLAPVYPGQRRRCHDPLAVRDLVRRLDAPAAGMLLDLGHLHITADATRSDVAALLAACAPDAVLFHAHDNLGRRRMVDAPGIDPIRLDLHLPPGRGTLPWARVAGIVGAHAAPVMLEVERSHRPALDVLARDTARLLTAPLAAAA